MARGLDWDVPPFEACYHTESGMPGILKRHAVQPEKRSNFQHHAYVIWTTCPSLEYERKHYARSELFSV